jgi:hypothetical protein
VEKIQFNVELAGAVVELNDFGCEVIDVAILLG